MKELDFEASAKALLAGATDEQLAAFAELNGLEFEDGPRSALEASIPQFPLDVMAGLMEVMLGSEKALRFGTELDPGGVVFLAFMWTEDDRKALADELFQQNRQTYQEVIRAQLREIGCDDKGVYLDEGQELTWLREQAEASSRSIVQTRNQDLGRIIDKVEREWLDEHGSHKGLNRSVYAKRVQAKLDERDVWKDEQIDVTEHTMVYAHGAMKFMELNSTAARVEVVPYGAVCPVCQHYVDQGAVDLAYAQANFILPAHPNCPHGFNFVEVEALPCAEVWRGGSVAGLGGGREAW